MGIEGQRSRTSPGGGGFGPNRPGGDAECASTVLGSSSMHTIECKIRCDMDMWASALDMDPPPQNIGVLHRHWLSEGGSGLWVTLMHDALFAVDECLLVILHQGPMASAHDKGVVMVNDARVLVDTEELAEEDIRALSK